MASSTTLIADLFKFVELQVFRCCLRAYAVVTGCFVVPDIHDLLLIVLCGQLAFCKKFVDMLPYIFSKFLVDGQLMLSDELLNKKHAFL